MKKTTTFLLPLVVTALLIAGCGKGSKGPNTVPVSGTLKIGGSPAASVQITFHPIDSGLQSASGNTDDSGKFTMFTGQTGTPGVMKGKYKVVLRSLASDDAGYMDQAETGEEDVDGGVADPVQKDAKVPEKYTKAETSDEEVEITKKESGLVIEING